MRYSGIDLHSNDEVDRVLVRRRVPNDAANLTMTTGQLSCLPRLGTGSSGPRSKPSRARHRQSAETLTSKS
jgi:hypothetical protein